MFTASSVGIAFVGMFACVGVMELADNKSWTRLFLAATVVTALLSLYCAAAGIFLLSGWQDPLAAATPEQLGRAAARGRRGGGLVILVIRFLPYVLSCLGGYFLYVSARILWVAKTRGWTHTKAL